MKDATIRAAGAAAALLTLAACPLPQPLAEVARSGGSGTTPPTIVSDSVRPPDPRVPLGKACTAPSFTLSATVEDANTTEAVEARWFVDYDAVTNSGVAALDAQVQPLEPNDTLRPVTPFVYQPRPFQADPTVPLHVVELVVSNGFRPIGDPAAPVPNRSPLDGFDTQVYRWVFEFDDAGRCQ